VLEAESIMRELREMYARRGVDVRAHPDLELTELGFRSLDFSELALRLEERLGRELDFAGTELRRLATVGDVIDLLRASSAP
jgi:acyl carrier protein